MLCTLRAALMAAWFLLTWSTGLRAEEATTIFFQVGPVAVHGNEADLLQFGVGAFDFTSEEIAAAVNVEYRFGRKVYFIGPAYGLMANAQGGLFGYGAWYADLSWNDIYFTPLAAIGGWREGDSKDLGGVFQFRLSLDIAKRFADGSRLGIRIAHISNANIHKSNPGEEELLVTHALALGPFL